MTDMQNSDTPFGFGSRDWLEPPPDHPTEPMTDDDTTEEDAQMYEIEVSATGSRTLRIEAPTAKKAYLWATEDPDVPDWIDLQIEDVTEVSPVGSPLSVTEREEASTGPDRADPDADETGGNGGEQ